MCAKRHVVEKINDFNYLIEMTRPCFHRVSVKHFAFGLFSGEIRRRAMALTICRTLYVELA
jgi:hypothetical protein